MECVKKQYLWCYGWLFEWLWWSHVHELCTIFFWVESARDSHLSQKHASCSHMVAYDVDLQEEKLTLQTTQPLNLTHGHQVHKHYNSTPCLFENLLSRLFKFKFFILHINTYIIWNNTKYNERVDKRHSLVLLPYTNKDTYNITYNNTIKLEYRQMRHDIVTKQN